MTSHLNAASDEDASAVVDGSGPDVSGRYRRPWAGPEGIIAAYTGVGLLIAMMVAFALDLGGSFLSWQNLTGVLASLAVSGLVSLGVLVPLAAGVFDVSVAGSMTLFATLTARIFIATNGKMPIVLVILIVLVGALVVGSVNGWLVVHEGLDSFIVTIGMGTLLLGVSEWVSGGVDLAIINPAAFLDIGRNKIGQLPITVLYTLFVALVLWYILEYTPLGRRIYATGAGREAARLSGVRTDRIIFGSYMVSAFLAGLAGVVYVANLGASPPDLGSAYLLPAFSAAFLGSTIIKPGRFNVPGLLIAMLIVGVGINGLQLLGVQFWIVDLFQGAALVIAVFLAKRLQRTQKRVA
jgi:ribose transport system permease protein